ncbi:hypothetical protein PT287_01135 [Lactobacillus sp. ESL0679]|uniref:hypothetical protein n=1 Tax=Lactobacillus sp. ESL0679 TaxID=2983209 RepID=UPI0023F7B4D7|nr:hypothetical protein [Lactobacillus sp. ESL0679]MDF7682125.1 hypothetical protein [Lactobacillus sp. ESL0679]
MKFHYERGDYDDAPLKADKAVFYSNNSLHADDYQLGYLQAENDYYQHRYYHHYPQFVFVRVNQIVNHRMYEVVDFIAGYYDFKKQHPL